MRQAALSNFASIERQADSRDGMVDRPAPGQFEFNDAAVIAFSVISSPQIQAKISLLSRQSHTVLARNNWV
jgi:hypothetical protein